MIRSLNLHLLVSRWILLCHFWMGLSPRRWLLALLRTSLPINVRRNWLEQKVENIHMVADLAALLGCAPFLTVMSASSAEPGAVRPVAAHQHVLLQHHRQTVSYAFLHELWSVRQ